MSSTEAELYSLRERVKWRSRRGLLELDIFFTRFMREQLDSLDAAQFENLLELLVTDDHELWAWVNGRVACEDARFAPMLAVLHNSGPRIEGL